MHTLPPRRPRAWAGPALAAALLLLAAALRCHAATRETMWFDELYTLAVATRPLADVLRMVALDVHPPLHYLLVWAWTSIGGTSDLWVKGLAILLGVASIGAAGLLARAAFGGRAALLAMALLALHRTHIAFSIESRSYALLMLALTLALWAAWRWFVDGRRAHAAAFVLAAAASLYTHYLTGVVLAVVAFAGFALAGPRRRSWLVLLLLVAVLFAPQMPAFLAQTARLRADTWVPQPSLANLVNWMRHLALGAAYLIPALLLLAALPLFSRAHHRQAALLWLSALAPPILLWALSMASAGVFIERHMFFALPAWAVLVAGGLLALRPPAVAWIVSAALLLAAGRSAILRQGQPEARALSAAALVTRDRVAPGDVVVHADAHSLTWFRHYRPDAAAHVLLLPGPALAYYEGDLVIPDSVRWSPARLAAALEAGGRLWGLHLRYRYAPADTAATLLERAASDTAYAEGAVRLWRLGGRTAAVN